MHHFVVKMAKTLSFYGQRLFGSRPKIISCCFRPSFACLFVGSFARLLCILFYRCWQPDRRQTENQNNNKTSQKALEMPNELSWPRPPFA